MAIRGAPPGPRQRRGSSPASGPQRWTCPKMTQSASTPSRCATRASAGMLARRICAPEQPSRDRRQPAAEQAPRDVRHRGGAQQLGQVVGQLGERARQPAGQQRLQPRHRRAAGALVVGRRGAVARQAPQQPAGDPVGGLRQQVAIEVVAVRRPDAVARARRRGSGRARARAPARTVTLRERGRGVERDGGVDAERRAVRAQPRAHELGVVVAGHDDHLALAAQPRAERAQHRLGDLHRLARAPLRQLDDVAEQHQALDAVERGQQRVERLGAAQDVVAQAGAEVQVGDDERGHAGATMPHSAWRCPRGSPQRLRRRLGRIGRTGARGLGAGPAGLAREQRRAEGGDAEADRARR